MSTEATPSRGRKAYDSGVVAPRHPITGETKSGKPTLCVLAREGGWRIKEEWDGLVFTKDGRKLHVRTHETTSWVLSAILNESPNHGGMFIDTDEIKLALFGTRCTCNSEGRSGLEAAVNPSCPFTHHAHERRVMSP